MVTSTADPTDTHDAVRSPSVLVVLVVRDGARWLREGLRSIAGQRYPRLGVIAVDNGSTDGSREILLQALGERRVITLDDDQGVAGALGSVADLPASKAADYLLVLHDDAALAPDAVARLVDAAEGRHGVEQVGVVGPKVVDWDDHRILREVGRSTDSFGHAYTPLQEGERDQGQYDRVLEVLFVSSCAMLISREAWQRTGSFDERYGGHYDDLDFCWRARVAGFRVLMTPLAQARHRDAGARDERPSRRRHRSSRYFTERAGLASMLKDYSIVSLVWLLPLYALAGLVRLFFLALGRRFEDAYELLSAWGWNLIHLPGTVRRRVRAQSVRRVRDRQVRRFMSSVFRLPRWAERAEEILDEQLEEGEEEQPLLRERARSLALAHPVLVASVLAVGLGALAVRHFVGPEGIQGGVLAAFPGKPGGFMNELVSATRTTILGGTQAASPALAGLGGLSWLTFASTSLAQKVLLAALPPIAAVSMYRALSRQTFQPPAAVAGAVSYAMSALTLWSFSEGRIPTLVLLAALPVVWDRLDAAFAPEGLDRPARMAVSIGVAGALCVAFSPGAVFSIAVLLVVAVLAGRRRGRGFLLAIGGVLVAAALIFPVLQDLLDWPAASFTSSIGTTDIWSLLRLAPGGGPGTWALAAFLPIAAVLGFAIVGGELRGRAWRAMIVSLAGVALAWASAARYLPEVMSNPTAYLAVAAVGMSALVGYGLAALTSRLGREAFGVRQLVVGLLAVVLSVGIGAQALQAALAEWAVSPNGLPPAWPVVASSGPGEFRILWLGRPSGDPFAAPGGDPAGLVEAGAASVRYAITDRDGITALDTGRGDAGSGYGAVHEAVQELLAGATSHGGELLAPFGVRFVVAGEGDLPPETRARLEAQLDLDLVPAGGLVIFRNARDLPVASVVDSRSFGKAAAAADPASTVTLPEVPVTPLERTGSGWQGTADGGYAYVSSQFDEGYEGANAGSRLELEGAFGWAIGGEVQPGEVSVSFTRQWVRTAEMWVLAVLWLIALWVTRKPVST